MNRIVGKEYVMRSWWNHLRDLLSRTARRRPLRRSALRFEVLEDRLVPSSLPLHPSLASAGVATPRYTLFRPHGAAAPLGSPGPVGLNPTQVRHAYGIDQVTFGSVRGDGSGQTIAIVDAYDDPTIAADLHQFDLAFGLPDPTFTKVNENGGSTLPAADTSGWALEISLDVEWAHAIAPKANIVLVEANSSYFSDLIAGVNYARSAPGVSVVSMSFGGNEWSGETGYNSTFTTPAGHTGVTFVASTGDSGAPAGFPAVSPNVLAAGGTYLSTDSAGNYLGESGWSSSGGGISTYEGQAAYQHGIVTQSGTFRTTPDVAFDADPSSGVGVYDSYNYGSAGWVQVGGTSFSAPAWAGLIAVADQGRVLSGAGTLDGPTGTLPALYQLPASAFHDVTSGNNGFPAGPGYDLVTGRGSPIANVLIPDLVRPGTTQPPAAATHFAVTASAGSVTVGAPFTVTVQALDASNIPTTGYTGTVRFTSSDGSGLLPGNYTFTAADQGRHTFSLTLQTLGTQTVTATDTASASIAGSATVAVNRAAAAVTHFGVTASSGSVMAGSTFTVTVQALDANNNVVPGYTGTVHFTTSDPQYALPGDYTFTANDAGSRTFAVALGTAGRQTVTMTDTTSVSLTGAATLTVTPAAASHFVVTASPGSVAAGSTVTVQVTALDPYNNVATGYAGTVHFTSTDHQAGLPGSYTFTSADAGVHRFGVTLKTAGSQSVTVTDASSVSGSVGVSVNAGGATQLSVAGFPSVVTAGTTSSFTVTARDAYGNTLPTFTGTVVIASSDPQATLPAAYTFGSSDHGSHLFSAALKTAGTDTLTATGGGLTGSESVKVNPGAVTHFKVSAPASAIAGSYFTITVSAADSYNNTVPSYTGTVRFTSTDPQGILPPNYTFTSADAGTHTFALLLRTSGVQTVTVTDRWRRYTGSAPVSVTSAGSAVHSSRSGGTTSHPTASAASAPAPSSPGTEAARDALFAAEAVVWSEYDGLLWSVGHAQPAAADVWLTF
jgi:hypothetical protein